MGDYFVDRYQKPTLDDVSNVYDASGFEVADGDKTVSFITFTRELAASDTVQDLSIDPNQPAFFIWAANVQVDPISFDQVRKRLLCALLTIYSVPETRYQGTLSSRFYANNSQHVDIKLPFRNAYHLKYFTR